MNLPGMGGYTYVCQLTSFAVPWPSLWQCAPAAIGIGAGLQNL